MKIKIFLLAFTRTSPLNAGVSRISLTSINLPGGQFKSSDNSNTSSLPCTAAAAQRLAWGTGTWPFSSPHVPWPYLRLDIGSLSRGSTSNSGFDTILGGISDLKLQSLWLLQSSPSGFDACFRLPCTRRWVPSALAWRRRRSERAPALAAGGRLNRARTGNLPQQPCPGSSDVNESCYNCVYIL